jgi:myo-inositol 2-dehydrogenase / D-chiro-inositol 1-dehydrogenase
MLQVALFGAGRIGTVHAGVLAAHDRAQLVWVCDPIESSAKELATRHGARPTSSVEEVLADATIDAVVIGSPTPTHVDLITAAVLAGKAVMCEKPIDLDLTRVDACWAEIADADPTVMIGFNRRFDPSIKEIRDRVAAGDVGRLEQLLIISRDTAPAPKEYMAVSGGIFRDMTIHDFDTARYIAGEEIVEVNALGANVVESYIQDVGDVDSTLVSMRTAGGTLIQITNNRRCVYGYDQRIEAFGSTGMLSMHNQLPTTVRFASARGSETAAPYLDLFQQRYAYTYPGEINHFLTAVENGTAPQPSFADGRAALRLADAATESLHTGRTVSLR